MTLLKAESISGICAGNRHSGAAIGSASLSCVHIHVISPFGPVMFRYSIPGRIEAVDIIIYRDPCYLSPFSNTSARPAPYTAGGEALTPHPRDSSMRSINRAVSGYEVFDFHMRESHRSRQIPSLKFNVVCLGSEGLSGSCEIRLTSHICHLFDRKNRS
ncbi:uncharacterized protein F4817DRAFT_328200 [Daldinia loculata]|uniref:uncharacterized protein n=1 Tax=Daldinia loculata TaxID=103429 RepID=UPI0020C3F48D|nr:uncharacterized protein F4817DRAFT_328200 [Daldinia loculata]KAI1650100.1 hypothetical protein F4817DRAFT_328200 [Daldinia loculata]